MYIKLNKSGWSCVIGVVEVARLLKAAWPAVPAWLKDCWICWIVNFEEDNSRNDILNQKSPVFINNNLKSIIPKDDAFKRTMNKKLSKIKKLKGSIHIQNIYNDLVKTKENVRSYQNKKEPKLKFLYSLFNNKKAVPFQKEDKENYKIKKLDRDLFWTVNEFHNN